MERSLRKGALGLLDSAIMAIAGSAPAYSITASTAALIAAVGLAGPAALLIAFLPMTGITIAFSYLNMWRSDAGAAYAWVGRAIHPALGFIAGWALLSLSTIFMVAAALPAGEATLDLVAPGQLHNVLWATAIGTLWFLGVLALVTCGITATAKVQAVLTLIEVGCRDPHRWTCDLALAHGACSRVFLGLVLPVPFRHLQFLLSRDAGRDLLFFRLGRVVQSRGRNRKRQDTRPASAASPACS